MIEAERRHGRAPDGPDPTPLATLLLELNDPMLERLTVRGALSREELKDGAVTIWLRTIYGTTYYRAD